MHRKGSRLLLTLLSSLICCCSAWGWPHIPPLVNTAQVEQVSRARIKALASRNDAAFAKYYMPDFQMTTAWGTVEDIGFLQRWIKTAPPGLTLTPLYYHVTVSADAQMAFATFQIAEVYPDPSAGTSTEITSHYTEIYVHRHGTWLLQAAHFSYETPVYSQNVH